MILLDTHALFWWAVGHPHMGIKSRELADEAAATETLHVSAISLWELSMLVEKGRLVLDQPMQRWAETLLSREGMRLAPITADIAVEAGQLRQIHGDPADRLLIATARLLKCPLMTADRLILAYSKEGHVETIKADD